MNIDIYEEFISSAGIKPVADLKQTAKSSQSFGKLEILSQEPIRPYNGTLMGQNFLGCFNSGC